jgi:hypothetical protein
MLAFEVCVFAGTLVDKTKLDCEEFASPDRPSLAVQLYVTSVAVQPVGKLLGVQFAVGGVKSTLMVMLGGALLTWLLLFVTIDSVLPALSVA